MEVKTNMGTNTKYIFVTGGVLSGVGKGITAASIGAVLQSKGLRVSIQKCDPYLNVDAGLLNPKEHGECFVTKDGAETDLDLGHYERFLDIELTQKNATLAGRLLKELIDEERAGKFGGQTIQLVPHLTGAIMESIAIAGRGSDVHIVEIGGTVGDYEGLAFLEAIREFGGRIGRERCLYVHVVYVPFLGTSHEFKSKPAQNALNDLRGYGIVPDVVGVRVDGPVAAPEAIADKISKFGGIPRDGVVMLPNCKTVYEVPLTIARDLDKKLSEFTGVTKKPALSAWRSLVDHDTKGYERTVTIGLVAKYMDNTDTYLSVIEALKSAGWANRCDVDIRWIDAEKATDKDFASVDGLLVPGGFGSRGIEGKIAAARYALDHNKPYLGICLGLQVAVIAAARKAGLADANSTEFDPGTTHDVVYIMSGQEGKESTGGTLRLGNYPATLKKGSRAAGVYGEAHVTERHRHRYEVNQKFLDDIKKGGIVVTGTSPDKRLVEYIEAPSCDYFVGTQAHPEFRSRPMRAHPLFVGLIRASK
jgi:CTP synthase